MAKARQVRRALERAGWEVVSVEGSHRKYRRGGAAAIFAFHDREDLGGPAIAKVAKQFRMTAEELRRLLWMADMVRTQIRVEYFYDGETERWDYVVPQLHIVGGGGPTRADATRRAAEAIAFALGDGEASGDQERDVEYLPVVVG